MTRLERALLWAFVAASLLGWSTHRDGLWVTPGPSGSCIAFEESSGAGGHTLQLCLAETLSANVACEISIVDVLGVGVIGCE